MSVRVNIRTPRSRQGYAVLGEGDTVRVNGEGFFTIERSSEWVVELPARVRSVIGIAEPKHPPVVAVRVFEGWWNITGLSYSVADSEMIQRIRQAKDNGGYWKVLAA